MASNWPICKHNLQRSSIFDDTWDYVSNKPYSSYEISSDGNYLLSSGLTTLLVDIWSIKSRIALISSLSPLKSFNQMGLYSKTNEMMCKQISCQHLCISNLNKRVAGVYECNVDNLQTKQLIVVWDTHTAAVVAFSRYVTTVCVMCWWFTNTALDIVYKVVEIYTSSVSSD